MNWLLQWGDDDAASERVWRHMEQAGMCNSARILAPIDLLASVRARLGDVAVVAEPAPPKSGEFAAAAYACAYLRERLQLPPDEWVCILLPGDGVDETFCRSLLRLEHTLRESTAEAAFVGVWPKRARFGQSYIVTETAAAAGTGIYPAVSGFVDKASMEEAHDLFVRGALQSCGVTAFRLGAMDELMKVHGVPRQPESLIRCYGSLPRLDLRQALFQLAIRVVAVVYDGNWPEQPAIDEGGNKEGARPGGEWRMPEVIVRRRRLFPGEALSYPGSGFRELSWTIVRGIGICETKQTAYAVGDGEIVKLGAGEEPTLLACTPLELIEVLTGARRRSAYGKTGNGA
ncbi:MAG: hypothetical protein J7639_15925 [Paenibacillaceae bacterium]|nr:hypothetical protein [Paenibacillaceae bacterium]